MKKWSKTKRRVLFAAAVGTVITAVLALDVRLAIRQYTISTGKLTAPVRIALITDLHSCTYGPGQTELLDALQAQSPDLVLLGGDIVDDDRPAAPALVFLEAVATRYPCYYVTGNHEYRRGGVDALKAAIRAAGITVLEGDCAPVQISGQTLNLCGVDDPAVGEDVFRHQLEQTAECRVPGAYTLLLSHHPERIEQYAAYGFDLVLSGHAHGGQWRIPLLLNGLIAPNQGLFPEYAGGLYAAAPTDPPGGTTLLLSRGLARESTPVPRIFNRPELVILDLLPA